MRRKDTHKGTDNVLIDLGFDDTADGTSNGAAHAMIEGDGLLVREILINLLDNAVRYTQPGGRVTVRVAAAKDRVQLCVEDNGPGIPAEERERVFERFHRVLGSGAEGCGLGLAIVREIAQSHNADARLNAGQHRFSARGVSGGRRQYPDSNRSQQGVEAVKSTTLIALLLAAAALLAIGGCASTTEGGAVGAERRQLLLVSSEQLEQMSAQSYIKLRAEAQQKGVLNTDAALTQRVRAIASRIEPQTKVFRADAPGWKWEVNVISSNELNAFCMPGGKIVFYSGLIKQLNLTDDEIAIVMGHEISHALREHSREQVSQAMAAQGLLGVGSALLGLGDATADMAGTAYQALIATKFSRVDEAEADRIGLELTARAGYDPRAGVALWQKMMKANQGSRPPEFLSTHPAEASRIEQIQALLPTVTPLYEQARRKK